MGILIFLLFSYIALSISLYFLFPKANVSSIKGLIPGINFVEWCKLIGRKPWYALWLLFPIVNIFIYCGMAVDLVRSFGKYGFVDSAWAVIYAPYKFLKIAFDTKAAYVGPTVILEKEYQDKILVAQNNKNNYELQQLMDKNPYKKGTLREWTESLVFAVFAASFIRMFLIEAYVIPTPSMEGSLNVGDFLFVSKAHYGIRMPMTIAMLPLVHNQIPIFGGESYFKKPSLPYRRLPALETVEAGKPFVFNWPVGDSVYLTSSRSYAMFQGNLPSNDRELNAKVKQKDFVVRPLDKKDHYIKRCVAGPGDSLQIIDRQIYLNGQAVKNPRHLQFLYHVILPENSVINNKKLDEIGIDLGDVGYANARSVFNGRESYLFLDNDQVAALKSMYSGVEIDIAHIPDSPGELFPYDTLYSTQWTKDNYGPIWVPKAGVTTPLNMTNLPFYRRIIDTYENNVLEVKPDGIYINGSKTDSYTFKQDYYWAMGDNRHNSEDSRAWGYVPFDHVVGKPLFIWFSTKEGNIKNGINWDRIFKSASSFD